MCTALTVAEPGTGPATCSLRVTDAEAMPAGKVSDSVVLADGVPLDVAPMLPRVAPPPVRPNAPPLSPQTPHKSSALKYPAHFCPFPLVRASDRLVPSLNRKAIPVPSSCRACGISRSRARVSGREEFTLQDECRVPLVASVRTMLSFAD